MRRLQILAVFVVLATGCFGQPGSRDEEALGSVDHEPTGSLHRPGQPCLVCHGADYTPGDEVFRVAGTVYDLPSSTEGLDGVTVVLTDADGQEFRLESNRAGNFYMESDDGDPRFPLWVSIESGGTRTRMESPIMREGSCAHCHTREGPGRTSVGQVYLREAP